MRLLSAVTVICLLLACSAQDCDWSAFFEGSNALCTVSGVEVDCTLLKPTSESVDISCEQTLKLTGYTRYQCQDGVVYPRVYSSRCVRGEEIACRPPTGTAANNMVFVRDGLHVYNELSAGVDYRVKCKYGFMFRDGVDDSLVTGKCDYVNRRATIVSDQECLPACEVKDNNRLSDQIDNLDRIKIVYPSNVRRVGDGKVVHAKAQCNSGYSPANDTVKLVCATRGTTAANSGYYLQTCTEESQCLKCNENCRVPEILDGTVLTKSGDVLSTNTPSIKTGEKTAYVECSSNMNLIGNRHISCSDGVITSELPSCSGSVVCSPPVDNNGYSTPDTSSTTDSTFTISCKAGYALGDPEDNKVKCEINGSEANYSDAPKCLMGCGIPTVKNGEVLDTPQTLSRDQVPYQTNESVEVQCNEGFIQRGSGVPRCDVTGWVNLPKCLSEEEISQLGKVQDEKDSTEGVSTGILFVVMTSVVLMW